MNIKLPLIAFLAVVLSCIAGTDNELTGTFESCEGVELGQDFSNMWNSGKLEVIETKFASYSKCLRITSDNDKDAGVRFNVPFAVKKGDCIMLETVFRGTGYARIGIFGSDLFKAAVIPLRNQEWDKRQEIFEISSDKCKTIHATS